MENSRQNTMKDEMWTYLVENYYKGKNVEPELSKEKIPIPNLPENFIWMKVSGGSKMRNLLSYALKEFENERAIVWSGSGCAIGKVISCVEIMKRHYTNAFQINKICYHKNEEYWEPYFKEMDSIVVEREIPTIHILLSKDELNKEEPGYQAPGTCEAWRSKDQGPKQSASGSSARRNKSSKISPEQFAAMGLRSNQKRAP